MDTPQIPPARPYDDNRAIQVRLISLLRRLALVCPRRSHAVAVVVLTANGRRRRSVRRAIDGGCRGLARAMRLSPDIEVSIIIQQTVGSERPLSGCYQICQRCDGGRRVMFRIASVAEGRFLDIDTMLAVLAEEWIGFVTQQADGPSVSVPIELPLLPPAASERGTDPRLNGWEARGGNAHMTGRVA